MSTPVMVMNEGTKRETGRNAQTANIAAAKAVADIIRTTLGPKSMLKMLLDPMGGIVMTNDGHAILREIDVKHPAAKSMIELSRAQDEEVGDGTTSVIILAGEMLHVAEPLLERKIHPSVITQSYFMALNAALAHAEKMSFPVDLNDREVLTKIVSTCVGTKYTNRFGRLMIDLAMDAITTVMVDSDGRKEIDVKRYAKIEKIPGGDIEDSRVLSGVMINKDIIHPKMKRKIRNPRVVLLDCPLEYKKGESQTNIEVTQEGDWEAILKAEEDWIKATVDDILAVKPDVVITEKGISDLAQHYLVKAGVTALRRMRKTDNNRIAKVTGATILNRPSELQESHVGTQCGVFQVEKIGDEYFSFFVDCEKPKACTILLRGPSKDVLNEIERNLHDCLGVARNVALEPKLLPGGGAVEMSIAAHLRRDAAAIQGIQKWPFEVVADALEVIPRTLAQNCGADVVRRMTELRAKHSSQDEYSTWGINGETGQLADMKELGIWEPFVVKSQGLKTAVESSCMLLRIDDVVAGAKKASGKNRSGGGRGGEGGGDEGEDGPQGPDEDDRMG
uniref:T-complex protein 1 subunit gamma n=1 Tax=Guillardia theta TaxID=55529 RepID=A0A7S4USL6_GUITH|mmetsp:Transcript_45265/g.142480  ORF Transcript_45265/g.142480 Transcript_45265/m.142480 type:complete len:562 (+) Transcript_45265:16-1701(+)